jgi:hypothetical protein
VVQEAEQITKRAEQDSRTGLTTSTLTHRNISLSNYPQRKVVSQELRKVLERLQYMTVHNNNIH